MTVKIMDRNIITFFFCTTDLFWSNRTHFMSDIKGRWNGTDMQMGFRLTFIQFARHCSMKWALHCNSIWQCTPCKQYYCIVTCDVHSIIRRAILVRSFMLLILYLTHICDALSHRLLASKQWWTLFTTSNVEWLNTKPIKKQQKGNFQTSNVE